MILNLSGHIFSLSYFLICVCFHYYRLTTTGNNLRSEPKHTVFLSQVLLFAFCHNCKADSPSVEAKQIGTKAVVMSTCSNQKCPKLAQPANYAKMWDCGWEFHTLHGYIVRRSLCFLLVLRIFAHMGLGRISLNTFFKCQRVSYCVQCVYFIF